MNWPPIEVAVDGDTTRIYIASTLAHTIPTNTENTLNIAADYAKRYQRTLPLTITDPDGQHYLEVHPDGQVTASEELPAQPGPPRVKHRAKTPVIIGIAATITVIATASAGAYLYTHMGLNTSQQGQTLTVSAERTIEPTQEPTPTATASQTPTPTTTPTPVVVEQPAPAPQPEQPAPPAAEAEQPAPPAAPAAGSESGWTLTDMSTTVSSNTGSATFTVTQIGGTIPTTVTIAGQTRTFTGTTTISGIPSGTYTWTTEADGLTNSGSIYIP